MGAFLLQLLGGNLIGQLTAPLERAYQAKLNAQNDAQRLDAEKQIAFYEGQIALAQTAAATDRWWSPRSLMAYCTVIVVAKLLIWDTVLGWGITPNPGSIVNGIMLTIIGFYFGSKAIADLGSQLVAAAVQRKR